MKMSMEEVEVDVGGEFVGISPSNCSIFFIISSSFSLIIGSWALVCTNLCRASLQVLNFGSDFFFPFCPIFLAPFGTFFLGWNLSDLASSAETCQKNLLSFKIIESHGIYYENHLGWKSFLKPQIEKNFCLWFHELFANILNLRWFLKKSSKHMSIKK